MYVIYMYNYMYNIYTQSARGARAERAPALRRIYMHSTVFLETAPTPYTTRRLFLMARVAGADRAEIRLRAVS